MITKRDCEVCGVPCFWNAFDLQWSHMGWTVNGKEQPEPHRPVIADEDDDG